MNKKQFETGESLLKLIKQTSEAIDKVDAWLANSEASYGGKYKTDFHYNLCFSEYGDGSGKQVDLARYYGNTELLEVIKTTLEKQLSRFNADFADL